MIAAKVERAERLKRNEEKWTPTLMEAGWTVLPSIILEKQHALGLDAIDINILMQLARYWWFSDNPPHPSKRTIAQAVGISESTVRKRIKQMEADGFIKRNFRFNPKYGGQETNTYTFDGLIKEATPHAKEWIAQKKKQQDDNSARRSRKKAKPVLVVNNEGKTR
jgi:predicted transcriptional regulator